MKAARFFNLYLIFGCVFSFNLNAATTLATPEKLEIRELNKEQKNKLQNIQYSETQAIPNQYKGKLAYTEGEEEIHLKDVRLYFGTGGRYTLTTDITQKTETEPTNTTYFNRKNKWEMGDDFNYYASLGIYWRNGIRIEIEYSQMTLSTENYGDNFAVYNGPDQRGRGTIFNQYLQKTATTNYYYNLQNQLVYTTLTGNTLPKIDLEVRTYMINFIFEKTTAKTKLRPYVGFGIGLVDGDVKTLVTNGSDMVLGGQVMVGLAYPFANDSLVVYLGYRGLFSDELEQTFTRVTGVSPYNGNYFDGKTYWNPHFMSSREKYKIQTHNIDFGARFYF